MNLKHLSNVTLLNESSRLAAEERRITTSLLYHLAEIEFRKAYAPECKSLHEFMTKKIHYAEGSAGRRISAMWALIRNPDLKPKIDSGSLNVSNVATVQSFIRSEEKLAGKPMSKPEKEELFQRAENASQTELSQALYEKSPRSAVRETTRPVAPTLHELRLFLSDEELALFREVQGLLAHRLNNPGSTSEALTQMIAITYRELVREKTAEPDRQTRAPKPAESAPQPAVTPLTEYSPAQGSKPEPRTPPLSVKRVVFRRAGVRCERIHPSGKRCESTFQLEIHHRVPFSQGGSSHDPENLELLCAQHHRIESVREFGHGWRSRKAG